MFPEALMSPFADYARDAEIKLRNAVTCSVDQDLDFGLLKHAPYQVWALNASPKPLSQRLDTIDNLSQILHRKEDSQSISTT